jgi:hypothetical protein
MIMPKAPCKPAAEYRTDAPREDGWTFERQAMFLMALAETGLVSSACKIVEMSPASAYALRREARGIVFHLGWQAAHLLARDRLEDVMLEAAISGVETISSRIEGTTVRRTLNGNLSMAVLKRLDHRSAALDDRAASAARAIGAAFEDFIALVFNGGDSEAITRFLAEHPDPLAVQAVAAPSDTAPQLVEKSAIFIGASISKLSASIPLSAPFVMAPPLLRHHTPRPVIREAA